MSLTVLIVDDSATVRAVIAKTLHLAEVPVAHSYEAANGKEALDILAEHDVDLLFSDINMPVMNGVEMIEQMSTRGLLERIRVVVVSTEGSSTRIEQLKSKGVSAYLRKPVTPETIRKVVHHIMGAQKC
ncbi:MAG TPA: response regulator [Phycisphaerae bacterium]|nr:response regulator [Phycisphaerae bacterium]